MSKNTAKETQGKTAITRFVGGHTKTIVIIALVVAIIAIGCAVGLAMHGRSVAIAGVKYEYSDSLGGYVASAASTDITGAIVLSEVDGKPVLALADEAFKDCSSLTKIELPNSLIRVGKSAFEGCANLEYKEEGGSLYLGNSKSPYLLLVSYTDAEDRLATSLPEGLKIIAPHAFTNSEHLLTISFPESLKVISDEAFIGAPSLGSVTLYEGLEYVGASAFKNCLYMEYVHLPESVKEIGEGAFENCMLLGAIDFPTGLTEIKAYTFAGCFSLEVIDLPTNLTTIGESAFAGCWQAFKGEFEIPGTVKTIGKTAFSRCDAITDLTIPDSVISMGEQAFSGCAALSLVRIGGVTEISASAFANCTKLNAVYMSEGITTVGAGAFEGCTALMACDLPSSITKLGAGAFYSCSALDGYTVYNGAGYLGNAQNPYVALVSVIDGDADFTMHPDTKCFAADVFAEQMGLKSITLAEGVTVIPDGAFFGCLSLSEVNLSDKTVEIGAYAFAFCRMLESIDLPETLTRIGSSAFYGTALKSIVIPESVEYMGKDVFAASGITEVLCEADAQPAAWETEWIHDKTLVTFGAK